MTRCPVGVVGNGDLVAVGESCREEGEEGEGDGGSEVGVHDGSVEVDDGVTRVDRIC